MGCFLCSAHVPPADLTTLAIAVVIHATALHLLTALVVLFLPHDDGHVTNGGLTGRLDRGLQRVVPSPPRNGHICVVHTPTSRFAHPNAEQDLFKVHFAGQER